MIVFFGGYKEEVGCEFCEASGWVWAEEIGAIDPHDCNSDDTRYTCPRCDGEGAVIEDKIA